MKKCFIAFSLVFLAAASYALRPLVLPSQKEPTKNIFKEKEKQQHFSSYSQAELYTGLNSRSQIQVQEKKVYGAVVSHHFFAEKEIAELLLSLKNQDYKIVVIVGPNHFNAGNSPVLVSGWPYQTPWGLLKPNLEIISGMENSGLAKREEQPFETEHSISVLSGFVKNIFPDAEIVPIILKRNLKTEPAEKIGEWLYRNLPSESLVLASVDFSHHQDLQTTLNNDSKSSEILKNLDLANVKNIEADSPQSSALLFAYLKLHKANYFDFINTNSAYLSGNLESKDVTSYFFASFAK